MRITVLQGSPNVKGSTGLLVDAFAKGAEESGHAVRRLDVAKMDVRPCIGCVACRYEGPCVQKDDSRIVKDSLLSSDMVVFATPLYYYNMTSQLKTVIDRFCSFNSSLTARHLKSALLAVAWNDDSWTFEALENQYRTLARYLCFEDCGTVLGGGCGTAAMTARSGYPEIAYEFGRRL